MQIATSEVGLQVYDGRTLPNPYSHIALEAQGFPDAPNRDDFPSVRLNARETYGIFVSYPLGFQTSKSRLRGYSRRLNAVRITAT